MIAQILKFPSKQQMPIGEKILRESIFIECEKALLPVLESCERFANAGFIGEANNILEGCSYLNTVLLNLRKGV